MSKRRSWLINVSLALVSVFVLLILFEFIAFRFILKASDMPKLDFVNGVVKYKPGQQGVLRVKNEINAAYNINADGWNSTHNDYDINKTRNTYRIAVVGDSFVEAMQVRFDESLAERLETKLGQDRFEVYRFGIGGAPLSHYLHMMRQEVAAYQPNLIVVVLVHNDFTESYRFNPGVYTSSFLKLNIDDGTVVGEVWPKKFQRKWYEPIRENSASWRYLAYRQQIRFQPLRDLVLGGEEQEQYQANIPVSTMADRRVNDEITTEYVFEKMKAFADENGAQLLLVMDGHREAIYRNADQNKPYETRALTLNAVAKRTAQRSGIHFIDLHPVFADEFAKNQRIFEFPSDNHWNAYAHQVVADTVYRYIREHRLVPFG